MEKSEERNQKKKRTGNIRIVFSSVILFILFLVEIYMMINSPDYFIGLVTVTILMIADLYILVTAILQVNYEKEQNLLAEFDDLFKSEKAMYLLQRKNFQEIHDSLMFIEDNLKTPTEEIISAQKAIAKVSIGRMKENTDAMMNSNEKLLQRVYGFEDLLNSHNDKLLEQQRLIIDQANKEILIKQQETAAKLKEVELTIKNDILQLVNTAGSRQQNVVMSGQLHSGIAPAQSTIQESEKTYEEPVITSAEDFVPSDSNVPSTDDILKEQSGFEIAEEMPEKERDTLTVSDLLKEESQSEETSFEPNIAIEEPAEKLIVSEPEAGEPAAEEAVVNEPEAEKPVAEEAVVNEPEAEKPAAEEAVVSEPAADESAEELTVGEPLTEDPAEIEKPPMPDLSDPNKIMSPDDIAALLANLQS